MLGLVARLDERFDQAVGLLDACTGRVIVTGMGKSGLIGRKIAATLASTGTPAYFLHPAEGVHGDIGMVARGDVVARAVELRRDRRGARDPARRSSAWASRIVLLTGKPGSTLARQCDVVVDVERAPRRRAR